MISSNQYVNSKWKSKRFMYHSFPRRRSAENAHRKGLEILELMVIHGLLLTPEILHCLILELAGTALVCTIPKELIERTRLVKPGFELPRIPVEGAPLGLTSGGMLNLMNILTWGLHEPSVLTGMIKGMASLMYPTERPTDPLLSYYQQREWRIIGGLLRDNIRVTSVVSTELREQLLKLDIEFFGRELRLPSGPATLVDECEVFSKTYSGEAILTLVQRVICPPEAVSDVREILRGIPVQVATFRQLKPA
jgi:hypothetical protein